MRKAVFLDRDGVINEFFYDKEKDLLDNPLNTSQLIFNPNIFEAVENIKAKGYLIVVISNQPAMALKKTSFKSFNQITKTINQEFKKNNLEIDAHYYCYHHPFAKVKKYRINCECRKPNIELFIKASKDLNIDLKKSWMIGDGVNDVKAGKNAGCKTILIAQLESSGFLKIIEKQLGKIKPNYLVKNIKEIVNII